jgi:hypothetical protein
MTQFRQAPVGAAGGIGGNMLDVTQPLGGQHG